MPLECAARSDVGRVREQNEDALSFNEALGLVVLADGMGGHKAGEIASLLAVETIVSQLEKQVTHFPNDSALSDEALSIPDLLKQAILQANERVFARSRADRNCEGMGTTLVTAWFSAHAVHITHVGDSRLYRLRHSVLEQMTRDDTVLQELISNGLWTVEDARQFRQRNLITRALGVDPQLEVTIREEKWQGGDLYLLCSDGLTDMLEDEEIETILTEIHGASLTEIADRLVDAANQQGGVDNISVLLARPYREDDNTTINNSSRTGLLWWRRLWNWKGF
jgi:PPM family protein phosphatase